MSGRRLLLLGTALLAAHAGAQQPDSKQPGIQDNSFLIEESYNQDWGVVQHINNWTRTREGDWAYTFTQEWPIHGIKHQLSYSLPLERLSSDAGRHFGVGDVALNYRYQLLGDGDARLAIAPRLTLLVDTGNERLGLGAGGIGLQAQLPLSLVLKKDALVAHFNIGMTWTPAARDAQENKASTTAINLGESLVWLLRPRFNLMLESVWARAEEVRGPGTAARSESLFVSPGVRWAYNFKSGLQIVPGLACPLGLGPSRHERLLLLYLSFEHPFKTARS